MSELRKLIAESKSRLGMSGQRTALFIDEIHRFNKAQQDAILTHVEDGTVTFIGATTENPSIELIPALLSRCQLVVLRRLEDIALEEILLSCERSIDRSLPLTDEARTHLVKMADGDGRFLLNLANEVLNLPNSKVLNKE